MDPFEVDNYMYGVDNLYSGDFMAPEEYDNYVENIGNLYSGDLAGSGYDLSDSDSSWLANAIGKVNWGNVLKAGMSALPALGGGLAGLLGGGSEQRPTGYQGKIPTYTALREQLPVSQSSAPSGEGAMGRRYFSDVQFVPKPPVNAAEGGLMGLAAGGSTGEPRFLAGGTDGMADKIPAVIEGGRPAKLGHGEFVIPSDCVSFLGSGNSEAGAKVLYDMMDRIRKHAHGSKKQIKPANLKKTLPA